jgi:hypothetical protein
MGTGVKLLVSPHLTDERMFMSHLTELFFDPYNNFQSFGRRDIDLFHHEMTPWLYSRYATGALIDTVLTAASITVLHYKSRGQMVRLVLRLRYFICLSTY